MEELVRYLITELVSAPDDVKVVLTEESEKVVIVNVTVAKSDMGKVIGKGGKIAESIRTIVHSAGMKTGKKYIVKIGEKEE